MTRYGWKWLEMAGVDGNDWKFLKIDRNGFDWLEMAGTGLQ